MSFLAPSITASNNASSAGDEVWCTTSSRIHPWWPVGCGGASRPDRRRNGFRARAAGRAAWVSAPQPIESIRRGLEDTQHQYEAEADDERPLGGYIALAAVYGT